MTKNSIIKDFTKYVSLNVLGMVSLSCYILVDTYFISVVLGASGLTALNIAASIFGILFGSGLMIGIGGAIQYAILKNKGDGAESDSIFTYAILTGAFVSVVFVIIGVFFAAPLAALLGADKTTLPLAEVYMRTLLSFAPVIMLNSILAAFVRNDSNPKLAMAGMVTGSFSNIVLDYVFLFPLEMGMFGAALATVCSMFLSVGVLSLHFVLRLNQFRLLKCKIRFKKIAKMLYLGSSAFINDLSLSIALITFNLVILNIEGNIGVAAYGIVANIAFIVIAIFTGVAQGIQPLLSKGYGREDNVLIKQVLKYAIVVVVVLSIIIYTVAFTFTADIVAAFNSEENEQLALLANEGLRVYFIGFFFTGINIIASAFFSSVANAKTGLFISVMRGCVIIVPMVIILSTILGMTGVWLSFVFAELLVFMLSMIFLWKKLKQNFPIG